jgi:hypothetical protein
MEPVASARLGRLGWAQPDSSTEHNPLPSTGFAEAAPWRMTALRLSAM